MLWPWNGGASSLRRLRCSAPSSANTEPGPKIRTEVGLDVDQVVGAGREHLRGRARVGDDHGPAEDRHVDARTPRRTAPRPCAGSGDGRRRRRCPGAPSAAATPAAVWPDGSSRGLARRRRLLSVMPNRSQSIMWYCGVPRRLCCTVPCEYQAFARVTLITEVDGGDSRSRTLRASRTGSPPTRSGAACSTAWPRRSANAVTATPRSPTSSGTPAPPSARSTTSSPARRSASSNCCGEQRRNDRANPRRGRSRGGVAATRSARRSMPTSTTSSRGPRSR